MGVCLVLLSENTRFQGIWTGSKPDSDQTLTGFQLDWTGSGCKLLDPLFGRHHLPGAGLSSRLKHLSSQWPGSGVWRGRRLFPEGLRHTNLVSPDFLPLATCNFSHATKGKGLFLGLFPCIAWPFPCLAGEKSHVARGRKSGLTN